MRMKYDTITLAKKRTVNALKALDYVKQLAKHSELTEAHRKQITNALYTRMSDIEVAFEGSSNGEPSFDFGE